MKLSQRSYPHPVVGNRDDVQDAAFQATVEMSADKQNIYLAAKIVCSSTTINELLKAGAARFVLHIECSNTLFRRASEFCTTEYQVSVPRDNLNDDVEVNTVVRATRDLPGYRVEGAHQDYGDASFVVKAGDIIAVGDGYVFPVEANFDSMRRIGSIMQIKESSEEGDQPMAVETNGDKIQIILSKPDFATYKLLKTHEGLSAPLTTSIVLPVLLEALHIMKRESAGNDDSRRWVRALTRRIDSLNLSTEAELLTCAQKLLEYPIKRSLAGAKQVAESS